MATLSVTHPTLFDLTKRLDPKGNIDPMIVELLGQTNEIISDMVWVECNQLTSHKTTIRTGIPSPTWRKINGGVQPTKSQTAQITQSCGMLANYAEVDKKLADLNGNSAAWRLSEDAAVIEGMNQEFASTLFYGNENTEPEAFQGLASYYNDQAAANGENILTSAATPDGSDNTSIWLVVWGPNTVHGIYPQGMKTGWSAENKGQVTIENADGSSGRMEAYRTYYSWDCGLCVRDWRYIVRINFDLEDVVAAGGSGPVLSDLMTKAIRRVPSLGMGRPAFYMNRDALDAFDLQSNYKSTLAYQSIEDAQGKDVQAFRRIPIRRCDAILSTEAGL